MMRWVRWVLVWRGEECVNGSWYEDDNGVRDLDLDVKLDLVVKCLGYERLDRGLAILH